MNRAEMRRMQKAASKKAVYNVDINTINMKLEQATNEGRREGLEWLNTVMLTVLQDYFEFDDEQLTKLKELVNFRIACLSEYKTTMLTHNDLKEQEKEIAESRAEHMRSLSAEEMAGEISRIIPKFIKLEERKKLASYLMQPYEG